MPADNDKPTNTPDLLIAAPDAEQTPGTPRFARLRAAWDVSWQPGGVLHTAWSDVRNAPGAGWDMAPWLRMVVLLTGAALALLLIDTAFTTITHWIGHLLTAAPTVDIGTNKSAGIWAVIDQPIRSYIAHHSTGMAVSGPTIYTLWQIAGLYGLIGGFTGSTIARLVWTAWGAASTAAIWTTVPDQQRTLTVAIAALAWGTASLFALRGLRLLPHVTVFNHPPAVKAEIVLPAQKSPSADDGLGFLSDTVQRPRRPF
ncbi:hypothetical protein ACFWFU_38780 [Streptomyces sp. NPDC060235]|uniref:hypothetical protein n=1 Tax=Streptomyces sp. NPDC060235 TaxID=3347080 RepID=UPI00364A83F1